MSADSTKCPSTNYQRGKQRRHSYPTAARSPWIRHACTPWLPALPIVQHKSEGRRVRERERKLKATRTEWSLAYKWKASRKTQDKTTRWRSMQGEEGHACDFRRKRMQERSEGIQNRSVPYQTGCGGRGAKGRVNGRQTSKCNEPRVRGAGETADTTRGESKGHGKEYDREGKKSIH